MSNFVTRKIRNGKVKINGRWYAPSEKFLKYDGRLDGQLYVFGLYDGKMEFICLWGSKKMSDAFKNEENWVKLDEIPNGDDCIDGKYPWLWWNEIISDTESNL